MNTRQNKWLAFFLIAVVVCAFNSDTPARGDKYEKGTVIDAEFELDSGSEVNIDVDDIDVNLDQTGRGRATVRVVVSGPDLDRAREYFEKLDFEAEVEGGVLYISTNPPKFNWGGFWDKYRNIGVKLIVTVPEKTELEVATSDGDIRLEKFKGRVELKTADGDIETGEIHGTTVRIRTTDGDVDCHAIEADDIEISTVDGDIVVGKVSGDDIKLDTVDGDIRARDLSGGVISVDTVDGDITVGVSGEELHGKTVDGDLRVELKNAIKTKLRATDGDIHLQAPRDLNARLNLRGDRVRVAGGFEIDGEVGKNRIVGVLGAGGPLVEARTSDGTIHLRFN